MITKVDGVNQGGASQLGSMTQSQAPNTSLSGITPVIPISVPYMAPHTLMPTNNVYTPPNTQTRLD